MYVWCAKHPTTYPFSLDILDACFHSFRVLRVRPHEGQCHVCIVFVFVRCCFLYLYCDCIAHQREWMMGVNMSAHTRLQIDRMAGTAPQMLCCYAAMLHCCSAAMLELELCCTAALLLWCYGALLLCCSAVN